MTKKHDYKRKTFPAILLNLPAGLATKSPMIPVGLVPIASVALIFLARMVELGTKRPNTVAGPVMENTTFRLFMLSGIVMMAGGIAEHLHKQQPVGVILFAAGWCCAVASFLIRWQAIKALGRFWSLHIEIRSNHEMVQDGPFRWMRHPTYFSMILELLSVGLILSAFYTLSLIGLLFVPALYFRIKWEEKALVEKFGDNYRAYQKSTPAVFPYKIPSAK